MKKELTVIDFFCGAGGFSEGFRQQGFKIVRGIDYWKPAIDTHNLNHNLQDVTKSVLDFWSEDISDISEIDALEDTLGIIGSPPCVSFSSSNKSGKADKSQGIRLIEAFLRVIAVKKHQKNSKLKFRYMENVPNSQSYVKEEYKFKDLNLTQWAESIGKKADDIALKVRDNGAVLNSGDYGAPQSRLRFICGEWCETGEFIHPKKTHENNHVTLGNILTKLPKPNLSKKEVYKSKFTDPNYPELVIDGEKLTDHFYDTGLYKIEWYDARDLKINHSYMGKMFFPENMDRPCRTIMATRSAKTRESLILKSEYERKGNGEYRLPTIREIASLMGFPITYQFTGSEGSKWRQIGNAVSPHLSFSLAANIKTFLNFSKKKPLFSDFGDFYENIENNLNTYQISPLDKPKGRVKNAKFRRHPYKSSNITVELMNFIDDKAKKVTGIEWFIKMYFGTGLSHKTQIIEKKDFKIIEKFLEENISAFSNFKIDFENIFHNIIGITKKELQKNYEEDVNIENMRNPLLIVENIATLILKRKEKDDMVKMNIIEKNEVPVGQLYVIYCLGKFIF